MTQLMSQDFTQLKGGLRAGYSATGTPRELGKVAFSAEIGYTGPTRSSSPTRRLRKAIKLQAQASRWLRGTFALVSPATAVLKSWYHEVKNIFQISHLNNIKRLAQEGSENLMPKVCHRN